ncbi:V-type ATP synthase subunit F [Clostridiaceae bacterium HSG29]|nr:V-type ATP synthase subunit F [Clostridiaceae bacterium HSG29]
MRSIIVTDNDETIVGLRLAGVEGRMIEDNEDFLNVIDELISDENIGIIMITQGIFTRYQDELLLRKLKEKETLIIEIPGFNEKVKKSLISEHIQSSIGLKL